MNKLFGLFTLCALLFLSCAMGLPFQRASSDPNKSSFVSSASVAEMYEKGYWITRPSGGQIYVLGIAGRRNNLDDAIAAALEDAARRVALYYGLHAKSAAVLNVGQGNLDYYADTDYWLSVNNEAGVYSGELVFDKDSDVLEIDGQVYVLAKYSSASSIPNYNSVLQDGQPNWVKDYALEIPGYLTGIGMSKNKGSPQRTYQGSYENAIVHMLSRLSTTVTGSVDDIDGGRMTQNITTSEGDLKNVIILETWFDRKTGAVWTLLIANEG
jgi:hypothetical protein